MTVGWWENVFRTMAETPGATDDLRKKLAVLLDLAVTLEWRASNPARFTDKYEPGKDYHDWTDAEIEQYRKAHALGTMARVMLELAFNTAARRCHVNKIERDHIVGGRIVVAQLKGNDETSVPMLSSTREALEVLPAAPVRFLVTTTFGKPCSDAGLGNRMRNWCDEAGLPHVPSTVCAKPCLVVWQKVARPTRRVCR